MSDIVDGLLVELDDVPDRVEVHEMGILRPVGHFLRYSRDQLKLKIRGFFSGTRRDRFQMSGKIKNN